MAALNRIREEEKAVSLTEGITEAIQWDSRRDRSVVTISGGRGWGKTTVLEMVLANLRQGKPAETIVLDPIYPEAFLVGDLPIGWIAASLAGHVNKLAEELRGKDKFAEADKLDGAYHRFNTRVQWCLVPRQSAWASSRESTEQVADALSAAARSGLELCGSLNVLLDAMFEAKTFTAEKKTKLQPLLVIPFDDIDLHPERLDSILELLPSIAALPRVAIIVAADLELLRNRMRRTSEDFFGVAGKSSPRGGYVDSDTNSKTNATKELTLRTTAAAKLAEDQMGKRFPWDLRFGLGEMSLSERLAFCPVGTDQSLHQLFKSIRLTNGTFGPRTFVDFFDLSWNYRSDLAPSQNERITQYTYMLPADPRSLTSLYMIVKRHARILAPEPDAQSAILENDYRQKFFFFLRDFVEFLAQRHPFGAEVCESLFKFNSQDHEIVIDATEWEGSVQARKALLLGSKEAASVFCKHNGAYQKQPLSVGTAALARLASEIDCWPVEHAFQSRIDQSGGMESPFKPLTHTDAERIGWPLPQFDSFVIHDAWQARWKKVIAILVAKYDKIERGNMPVGARLWLFWAYCRNMVDAITQGANGLTQEDFQQDAPPEHLWSAFVEDFKNCLHKLCEASRMHDVFARSLTFDLRTWAALYLSFLTIPDMALNSEVAKRALDVLSRIRAVSDGLGFEQDTWTNAEAEAVGFAKRLRKPLPIVDLDAVNWEKLANGLINHDQESVQMARYLVATSNRPNENLAQLTELMGQLGYSLPSPEKKLEDLAKNENREIEQ